VPIFTLCLMQTFVINCPLTVLESGLNYFYAQQFLMQQLGQELLSPNSSNTPFVYR
jgi:hypothetical protein